MSLILERLKENKDDVSIPILRSHKNQCLRVIGDETKPLSDLIEIMSKDASLCILILSQVNKNRASDRSRVINLQSAINLLGSNQLKKVIRESKTLEDLKLKENNIFTYKKILYLAYQTAFQAKAFAEFVGDKSPQEVYVLALLYFAPELALAVYQPDDIEGFFEYISNTNKYESIKHHYMASGTSLLDISYQVINEFRLSDILLQLFKQQETQVSHRLRCIALSYEIICFAEQNWFSESLAELTEYVAQLLDIYESEAATFIHITAINAARSYKIDSISPVAKGLVSTFNTFESGKAAVLNPVNPYQDNLNNLLTDLKKSLANGDDSTEVFRHIFKQLNLVNFNRIILFRVDGKSKQFKPYLSIGVEKEVLNNLNFALADSKLFLFLRKKPASIHMNGDENNKYFQAAPKCMQNSLGIQNSFLSSIFLQDRFFGILYADKCGNALDKDLYIFFKSLCPLVCKVLTRINLNTTKHS